MKNLGQRYGQFINRTYQGTGPLWEGRFKLCLMQEKQYVLACYRYIALNPVRARTVPHPRDCPEFRYGCNGAGDTNPLVAPYLQYLDLSTNSEKRFNNYSELIEEKSDEQELSAIRGAKNGNYALSNTRFEREIEIALGRSALS
jgi:putative transposase